MKIEDAERLERKRIKAAEYQQAVEDDKIQEYYLKRLRVTPDHKLGREEIFLKRRAQQIFLKRRTPK